MPNPSRSGTTHGNNGSGRRPYNRATAAPYTIPTSYSRTMPSHMHRDNSAPTMAGNVDVPPQPRKRIAMACKNCRRRKIRCNPAETAPGESYETKPCDNCVRNNIAECIFERVPPRRSESGTTSQTYDVMPMSTEYSQPAALARRAGAPIIPMTPASQSQYSGPSQADMLAYRQEGSYTYDNRSSYPTPPTWGTPYADGSGYGLGYHSGYNGLGYGSGGIKEEAYTTSEAYHHSHNPNGLGNFSLSSMASALATPDRVPQVSRTLPSSSVFRTDGLPGHFSNTSRPSAQQMGYSSWHPSYDTGVSYARSSTPTVPSNGPLPRQAAVPTAAATVDMSASYHHPSSGGSSSASDSLYSSSDHSYRSQASDGFVYGDGDSTHPHRLDRRDSQCGSGGRVGSSNSSEHPNVGGTLLYGASPATVNTSRHGAAPGAAGGRQHGYATLSSSRSAALRRSTSSLRET